MYDTLESEQTDGRPSDDEAILYVHYRPTDVYDQDYLESEFDSVLQDAPRAIIRLVLVRSLPSQCEIKMRKLRAEDPSVFA